MGTRPSDVAEVMSVAIPWTGRWKDDLLPRMHMMADRSDANDSLQRSHPITVGTGVVVSVKSCLPIACRR